MMQMMQGMQNPQFRDNIETKLQQLKEDPELASIMADIEQGGPAAMMKCVWVTASVFVKCWPLECGLLHSNCQ